MKLAAEEAGIKIVAGDTKVIEGHGGIYINTSGIGEIVKSGISISIAKKAMSSYFQAIWATTTPL